MIVAAEIGGWRGGEAKGKGLQHHHFPRGPPPQYYDGRNQLVFTVRMGRGIFWFVWP